MHRVVRTPTFALVEYYERLRIERFLLPFLTALTALYETQNPVMEDVKKLVCEILQQNSNQEAQSSDELQKNFLEELKNNPSNAILWLRAVVKSGCALFIIQFERAI